MKPLAFNLRDAKKIATDGKTSTFQVGKGHEIRILHSAIPALQRKQMERMPLCKGGEISKMADGGDVLPKYMKSPKNPKMEAVGTGGVAMAEGGKAEQIDLSEPNTSMTVPKTARDDAQKQMKDDQTWQKPADDSGTIKAGEYKMYAEGTPDQPVSDQDMAPQEPVQDVQPPEVAPPSSQQAQIPVQTRTPMPNPVNQMTGTQISPQVATTTADRPLYNQNGTTNVPAAVALQIEAAKQKRDADVAEGAQAANVQHGMNAATIVQAQNDQNRYNELKGHADDLSRDMQFINPNHYMESKSTLGRVATAMGLFLGGLGAGISHVGGNPVLDFINRQIDRDIDSQKANNEKRKTIYGAYKELYGEGNVASNMTKVSMNNLYDGQMKELAAKMATPRAMSNYNAFHADILLKNHELLRTSTADAAIPRAGGTNLNIQPTPLDRGPVRQQPGQGMNSRSNPNTAAANAAAGLNAHYGKPEAENDHILSPEANQTYLNLKYDPRTKDIYGALGEQKAKADLADKAIDAINEVFPQLQSEQGGTGYSRRTADKLQHVPFAGPMIKDSVEAFTDSNNNRNYASDYSRLIGAVRGALQGNVSEDLLDKTVKDNAPEQGDDKALVAKKRNNIKAFIREHTKTDLIDSFPGMSRKKKSK